MLYGLNSVSTFPKYYYVVTDFSDSVSIFSVDNFIADDMGFIKRNHDMNELKTQQKESPIEKSSSTHELHPFEEMERLFENFSTRGWLRPFHWEVPALDEIMTSTTTKMPCVDIVDRESEIVVNAELPGVEKKDLEISVSNNVVTIKGKTSHEEKEEKGDYYRCEISRGSYMRSVSLPAEVDESKAKANFNDGLLEITLPKLKKTKRHAIKVE